MRASSGLCGLTVNYGGVSSNIGSVTAVLSGGEMDIEFGSAIASELLTPWISFPLDTPKLSQSGSMGPSASPLSALAFLAQQGARVTNDGSVSVNGYSMHEYTVTVDSASEEKLVKQRMGNLPSG